MSLVLRLPREIHFCRSSSSVQRLPSFLDMLQNPHVFAHFCQGGESLAPVTQNDASTPKSGTNMWCFVHFDFYMCFAPQRRTLFEHLNFQKWSERGVFCTCSTACTFSTSQLPKVLWTWCALYILTSKCVSHHNGVHFFISHPARWLRTRRFSKPTVRPFGATKHWNYRTG